MSNTRIFLQAKLILFEVVFLGYHTYVWMSKVGLHGFFHSSISCMCPSCTYILMIFSSKANHCKFHNSPLLNPLLYPHPHLAASINIGLKELPLINNIRANYVTLIVNTYSPPQLKYGSLQLKTSIASLSFLFTILSGSYFKHHNSLSISC